MAESPLTTSRCKDLLDGTGQIRGEYFARGSSKTMYVLTDTAMKTELPLEHTNVLAFKYFLPAHCRKTAYRHLRILHEIDVLNKKFAPITAKIYGGFKLDVDPPVFMDRDELIKSFKLPDDEYIADAGYKIMDDVFHTLFIIEKLDCNELVVTTYDELSKLVDTIIDMGYCWTDIKINNICKGPDGKLKIIDLDPEFLFKLDVVVYKTRKDYATISKILKDYMIHQLYSTVEEENIEGHDKRPEMLLKDLKEMLVFINTHNKIFVEAIFKMQPGRGSMTPREARMINNRTPYAMYTMYTAPVLDHRQPWSSKGSPYGQLGPSSEKSSDQPPAKKPKSSCTISGGRIKKRRSTRKKMKKKPSKKYRSRRHKYTKRR
jgi:hypothetical protein